MKPQSAFLSLLLLGVASTYDISLAFDSAPAIENRTIDEIYAAALNEGGVVTVWFGGDEPNQQDSLKNAFETRFPGITLNITVDLSKYHDGKIDQQLATGNVYVDNVALQTVHDFPRWEAEGALLHYAPVGFYEIYPAFRHIRAAWYAVLGFSWSFVYNTNKVTNPPKEFPDFLKPEYKDKLVLTYPNDDDAVLFAFDLILQQYGYSWFERLLAQNPRWVRGTATPVTLLSQENSSLALTFTSSIGLTPVAPLNITLPQKGSFVSWGQTSAILKDAPHPEGAKLFANYLVSEGGQRQTGSFSIRVDVPSPNDYPSIFEIPATNPTEFPRFMGDRNRVERLRFFFEDKLGTAQGLSPLIDGV
ncbi:ABC transporter [Pleurostoma richardsiae]|uniref:ABC transporter n=1 Tax=Pleurostoma richardsiae TaxID=41990 RepID=A0AA38VCM8_9PEZI|nr:ABC transporter [Pleurostoma richardsiae]